VSNALVAGGMCVAIGLDLDNMVDGLESRAAVPGRLERIDCGQEFAVVVATPTPRLAGEGYASGCSGDARPVIVVFAAARPRSREAARSWAAQPGQRRLVIVTSDNPRPRIRSASSCKLDGVKQSSATYEVEVDRRTAIARAIALARPGDCY